MQLTAGTKIAVPNSHPDSRSLHENLAPVVTRAPASSSLVSSSSSTRITKAFSLMLPLLALIINKQKQKTSTVKCIRKSTKHKLESVARYHSGGCLSGVGGAERWVASSASVRTSPSVQLWWGSSTLGHRSSRRVNPLQGGTARQGGGSVPRNTSQMHAARVRKMGMRGLHGGGRRRRDGRSAYKAGVVFLVRSCRR